ncbi:MAG: heme-binding protein [Xanthobacteraceae bacterium]|uniref:GlcG/HbpS family heme-binding protein n=1 Tax=Pseudolabrys sp. TaxID=1960880 RepID=UPI003D0BC93C
MSSIDLETANKVIAGGIAFAREQKMKPLTFVILDTGGHLVSAQREDNSGILRFEIAFGKAWGGLGMGHSTRYLQDHLAVNRPRFVDALAVASNGRFIPVLGGVLIRDKAGKLLGALGITGDTADNDELVAVEAVLRADLVADTN